MIIDFFGHGSQGDIIKWCEEYCDEWRFVFSTPVGWPTDYTFDSTSSGGVGYIWFEEEADAAFFKLTFGGDIKKGTIE